MISVIDQAFEIIKTTPGLGAAALARKLKIPPCNARRAAKALIAEGRVALAGDQVRGYRYHTVQGIHLRVDDALPQVVDVPFREVAPPLVAPATGAATASPPRFETLGLHRPMGGSRALVPAAQPYDSRTAAALAQNAAARRSGNGPGIDPRIVSALNSAFVADPSGDETLVSLAAAWRETAAATRAAGVCAAREHAVAAQQRQVDAVVAEAARKAEQERLERAGMLRAVAGLWSRTPPPPVDVVPPESTAEPNGASVRPVRNQDANRATKFFTKARPVARVNMSGAVGAGPAPARSWWKRHFAQPPKTVWK